MATTKRTRARNAETTAKAARVKGARKSTKARSASPAVATPQLSSEDRATILELSKGSNSIELKLSIPAEGHHATIKSPKPDPVEAQPRQAFCFDTPALDLYKAGVVVRARRIRGGRADTVVKLRPVDPAAIATELKRSASFKIEVDAMPSGFVCSASFKGICTGQEVLDVTAGAMPLSALFTKEQRDFYDSHAPAGISMDALATLGPTFLLKAKHQPKDFDRRVTVEMWLYPDGSRTPEISTKALPEEAFQVAVEFKAYLARCGIALDAPQETKTKTALEFFSERLAAERQAG